MREPSDATNSSLIDETHDLAPHSLEAVFEQTTDVIREIAKLIRQFALRRLHPLNIDKGWRGRSVLSASPISFNPIARSRCRSRRFASD